MESSVIIMVLLVLAIAAHLRINSLQDRLNSLDPEYQKEQRALAKQADRQMRAAGVVAAKSAPTPRVARKKQEKTNEFLKWISTDWAMKLGAFMLLLAFAWLTTYAFMNNWIGPMGRIALGSVAGLLIMGVGEWRIRKYEGQGAVFLALGAATVLVTLFAARNVYDFFTPLTVLIGMFAVVSWMGISSLRHKNQALSIVGLGMGSIAPLLINSPIPDYFGLFSYLLVLTLGTLAVAYKMNWKLLTLLNVLVLFFYSPFTPIQEDEKQTLGVAFCTIFTVLFALSNISGIWKAKRSTSFEMATAIINNLLLIIWMNEMLPDSWKSSVNAVMGLVLIACSYALLRRIRKPENVTYVYYISAAIVLGFAAILEWENAQQTLAITWCAAGLIALAKLATKDTSMIRKFSPYLFIAVILGIDHYNSSAWDKNFFLDLDFVALLSQSVLLLLFAYIQHKDKQPIQAVWMFLGVMAVQSMMIAWLCAETLVLDQGARTLIYMGIVTLLMALVATLFKDKRVGRFLPLVLLPAIPMNMDSSGWPNGTLLHPHFFAMLSFVIILFGLGLVFRRYKEVSRFVYFTLSGLFAIILVWLSADSLIVNPNLHITVALATYTLAGLYFNIRGAVQNEKASRIAGGALIGFVAARLLLVDVWEMAIGAKVITFFIVGALLISTAFFNRSGKKKSGR